MCPTAHAGRRRSDVPQGEGLPILFSPPCCANTACGGCDHPKSGSDTLCGDNTDLVEKVGGGLKMGKMLTSKCLWIFLKLKK